MDMLDIPHYVARRVWDAKRFGLSPDKWVNRFSNGDAPRVLCVTIPKAGTHLLERALCLHPVLYRKALPTVNGKNIGQWGDLSALLGRLSSGQIIMSHLHFTNERLKSIRDHDVKTIFLIRDPRDIVVSESYYVLRKTDHPNHAIYAQQDTFSDCISLSIRGHEDPRVLSIGEILRLFEGWLYSDVLVVRFEDLIGPQGNGRRDKQHQVLRSIFEYLGFTVDSGTVKTLALKTFSNKSPTFNNGKGGRWRKYFTPEITEQFKETVGDALVRYGYESDSDW